MNWLWAVLLGLAAPALITFALNETYARGYHSAENKCAAQIEALNIKHVSAVLKANIKHQTELKEALSKSQVANREFLATQARLKKENKTLKESLHEATADTDCIVNANWLRHYRAALGVSSANRAGADTARSADDTTVTTTALLQHAIDYGHWCQGNNEQLAALQIFLRSLKRD